MPRILGIDIPPKKRIEASLQYIYGIGLKTAREICAKANVNLDTRAKDLTEDEILTITKLIQDDYLTEGDLRREIQQTIRRHMDIGTYQGLRHRRGLPVNGQRTKTNARTRKGRKAAIGGKKKK